MYTEALAGFPKAATPSLIDEPTGFRALDYYRVPF